MAIRRDPAAIRSASRSARGLRGTVPTEEYRREIAPPRTRVGMGDGWKSWYRRWRRDRHLTSVDRAGSWARGRARRIQYDFARRQWRVLVFLFVSVAAVSPMAWLLAPGPRGVALGLWWASAFWLAVLFVILTSGTASLVMGQVGEQWTASELRPLRRRGWRILNRAILRFGDIDHVAVGRPGIFVIETKWRAGAWDDSHDVRQRIDGAVQQVRKNRRDVALTLGSKIGDAPVRAAVVLWSAAPRAEQCIPTDPLSEVTILYGTDLTGWLARHEMIHLDTDQVDRAWDWLASQVVARDAAELAKHGPPPLTGTDLAIRAGQVGLGGLVSCAIAIAVLAWADNLYAFAVVDVALLGAGVLVRRIPSWRRVGGGSVVGALAAVAFVVAWVVGTWLA